MVEGDVVAVVIGYWNGRLWIGTSHGATVALTNKGLACWCQNVDR